MKRKTTPFIRFILLLLGVIITSLVTYIDWNTAGSPDALGGTMQMFSLWAIAILFSLISAFILGVKKLKKIDYLLFLICSPVPSVLIILLCLR